MDAMENLEKPQAVMIDKTPQSVDDTCWIDFTWIE